MGVFGYLDAGSGSMIVGAVAAAGAGVAVAGESRLAPDDGRVPQG